MLPAFTIDGNNLIFDQAIEKGIVYEMAFDGNDAEASEVPSEDSAESPEGDSDGAAKEGSKHRKIPTWGEAISVVVDANMTTRSKQPASKPAKGRRRKSKSKPKR